MKITTSKTFLAWCHQAPKYRYRINFDELPGAQKDQAVIAYCMDFNSRHMRAIALHLQSATCADNVKESAFRNCEYDIQELIMQYNDLLDLRDAQLADEDGDDYQLCEYTFKRIFSADQAMIDAGHKHSDFC